MNITTFYKKRFDPTVATADDIDIRDVAHALSLMCRANGHFPHFYSVGQHSLACAAEAAARGCSKRVQLGCLLHDAGEAFVSDITRPVKSHLPKYRAMEERLQNLILDKWISPSLTAEERRQVFDVDDAMLYYEFLGMVDERVFDTAPPLAAPLALDFRDFAAVEQEFLNRFAALRDERMKGE